MAGIALTAEQVKKWRARWKRAEQLDDQLRQERLRRLSWQEQWPIVDDLLTLAARHSQPRYPTRLIEYRRRLKQHFS